ncbi:MAG: monovalent cation/H+ antiporter complex subunit F [Opitutaceae bacterium]|jgi:multisubunit Na+/H+ antiporter MnhF subunit|nr:monovalent cation/H+ antiporter complex subunit F [Opitutaceae bacterium]
MNTLLQNFLYPLGWLVALLLAAVSLWRITRGPTTLDRMVGIDTIAVSMVTVVSMFSLQNAAVGFLELIIILTALGFFTTVSFYYYLAQPKRRPEEDFNEEKEGAE